MILKNVVLFLGPTTVNVRITGLTEGLHGFHLVSNLALTDMIYGLVVLINLPSCFLL